MCTLSPLEGEVLLDTKSVGSAGFPICMQHMLSLISTQIVLFEPCLLQVLSTFCV